MWMEAKQLLNNRVQLNLINLVSSFPPISEALQPFIEAINKHHTSCERSFTTELARRCLDDDEMETSKFLIRQGIVCMGTVWYVGGVFRKAGKLCVEGKLNERRAVAAACKIEKRDERSDENKLNPKLTTRFSSCANPHERIRRRRCCTMIIIIGPAQLRIDVFLIGSN